MSTDSTEFKFDTFDSLRHWTSSITTCITTCLMLGLLTATVICSCGFDMHITQKTLSKYPKDEGYCYCCSQCSKQRSLRTHSVFANSIKPLRIWLDLIFAFARGEDTGTGSRYASYERKQGGKIFSKFRKCCGAYLNANITPKQPNDFIIEIDESPFNKKTGAQTDTRWVFGMVERTTGKCKFVYVPDRKRKTLLPIIHEYIAKKSQVHSDMWRAYWILAPDGYIHRMVNHSDTLKDYESGVHTNTIEGMWKWAKMAIQKKGGCKDHQLQERLDEFAFRKTYLKDPKTNLIFVANVIAKYHALF